MKCIFNDNVLHTVEAASKHKYLSSFIHPSRILKVHDFMYIADGEFKLGIGNNIYAAKKDTVIILPANVLHHGIAPCPTGTSTMFIHVSCETGDGISDCDVKERVCIPPLIDASNNKKIKDIFNEIIRQKAVGNNKKASVYFSLLLLEIADTVLIRSPVAPLASNIKKYIDVNISENISCGDIAKLFNVSAKTAENAFKNTYKTTIHKYAVSQKISLAKFYLNNFYDMKFSDIALNLGFYDEYHFSRCFKAQCGMPPSKYKKESKGKDYIICP